MTPDELAQVIAASLLRHQSRGLVDPAAGMSDVVVHGRVDLTAVARDLLAAPGTQRLPARRSWAGWFVTGIEIRKGAQREERRRQDLADQVRTAATPVDLALGRLRLRALDTPIDP
jgi:hypothetical protein